MDSVLIPRSAPAERVRQTRTGVRISKDEGEQLYSPSCFETHRSAALWVDPVAFASRCDAPQHEGEGRGHERSR